MKNKKIVIVVIIVLIVIAAAVLITQVSKWSELSFEAKVQEIVVQADGETRLIVERTTEIYGNPLNSLGISDQTKLLNAHKEEISINDLQQGDIVSVTLKDSFTEETPFYYPIVYEIKLISD